MLMRSFGFHPGRAPILQKKTTFDGTAPEAHASICAHTLHRGIKSGSDRGKHFYHIAFVHRYGWSEKGRPTKP
jgi:hypothetical protein